MFWVVSKTASNSSVLGECRRLPLSIYYQKRYVKFWLKLLKSDEGSLLHQTQIHLDKTYKQGWVTDLKRLLFTNGFGHVWISDGVGDENKFLHEFSLRLADIAKQNWKSDVEANSKLSTYREIKSLLEPEKYLKEINNYFMPRQTVKFRISDHSLMIEKGGHHGMLRVDRICKQCHIGCIEDEFHFLLVCPKYKDLLEQYLPKYHTNSPNLRKFVDVLHSSNGEILRNLSLYICKSLKMRNGAGKGN